MKHFLTACFLFIATPALAAPTIHAIAKTAHRDVPLTLEYVTTPAAREQGLMHRSTLKPSDGMLFVFPETSTKYFWMKNTLIPLDILFLDDTQHVISIAYGVPFSEKPLGPHIPSHDVIELDSGRAVKEGITIGTHITYTLPTGTHAQ